MKRKLGAALALICLAVAGLTMNTALGQSGGFPATIGPYPFSLNGASGTFVVPNLNGQSFCTVTVNSSATMGSGTITIKTSNDNGASWYPASGVADLGNPSSPAPSQTITLAGTSLKVPVSGATGIEAVLSGASGAAITGSILCNSGSGVAMSGGASGPTPYPTPTVNATATACGAAVSGSNQTVNVPVCPSPYPTPTANPSTGCTGSNLTISCTGYGYIGSPSPAPTASVGTGTTANTYQTLATVTATTGVSNGPKGAWMADATEYLLVASMSSTENAYGCIVSANTSSTVYATIQGISHPCETTPSNALAGTGAFGECPSSYSDTTTTCVQWANGEWIGTIANSTTATFNCEVAGSSTSSLTVNGTCGLKVWPI